MWRGSRCKVAVTPPTAAPVFVSSALNAYSQVLASTLRALTSLMPQICRSGWVVEFRKSKSPMLMMSTGRPDKPMKSGSIDCAAPKTTWGDLLPLGTQSLRPVTVTVCLVDQFCALKVRLGGLTTPAPGSLLDKGSTTSATGARSRCTVKVALAPLSEVRKRLPAVTTILPACCAGAMTTAPGAYDLPTPLAS